LSVTWIKQNTITIYECVVMFLCSFIKARGMIFEYFTYKQMQASYQRQTVNCKELNDYGFLRMGVKMHYSNLNGCNSRMLWNLYPRLVLL